MDDFFIKIKRVLSNRDNKIIKDANIIGKSRRLKNKYKLAAVLFPIIKLNNEYKVILTTRSKNVLSHPGQVCFPGGKLESSDINMIECAKREAFEEVGIRPGQVEILGELDCCITGTDYSVTPIVGIVLYPPPLLLNVINLIDPSVLNPTTALAVAPVPTSVRVWEDPSNVDRPS